MWVGGVGGKSQYLVISVSNCILVYFRGSFSAVIDASDSERSHFFAFFEMYTSIQSKFQVAYVRVILQKSVDIFMFLEEVVYVLNQIDYFLFKKNTEFCRTFGKFHVLSGIE